MNKSYKSIWNDTLGTYVAAAETASSSGRKVSSGRKARKQPLRAHAGQLALEPRIVFDAALPATMAEVQQDAAQDLLLLKSLDALDAQQSAAETEAVEEAESQTVPTVVAATTAKAGEEVKETTQAATVSAVDGLTETAKTDATETASVAVKGDAADAGTAVVTVVGSDPVVVASVATDAAAVTQTTVVTQTAEATQTSVLPLETKVAETKTVAEVVAETATAEPVANERVEVIFVDAVVKSAAEQLAWHPGQVYVLDASRDGVEQMAEVLKGRTGIDAIHIISHGEVGKLELGSAVLDEQSMAGQHADELATIRAALSQDADILLYGCDVGAADAGRSFVAALATATGADVAASTDDTGAADAGGDWVLETSSGAIETVSIAMSEMAGLLATPVAANNGNGAILAVIGRTIYSVNTETGKVFALTTAPDAVGGITLGANLNSLAVNQTAGLIYYTDNAEATANVALFAYDFINDTHFVVDADVTDNGVLVGLRGIGSGGATFATINGVGQLFLGVDSNGTQEGSTNADDDTIYRIQMSADGRTIAGQATDLIRIIREADQTTVQDPNFGDLAYEYGATDSPADDRLVYANGTVNFRGVSVYNPNDGTLISKQAPFDTDVAFQLAEAKNGNVFVVQSQGIYQINPDTGAKIGSSFALTTNGTTLVGGVVADGAAWVPPTSTIGDLVFNDNDLDGVFDTGLDTGIEGVKVELFDDVNNNGVIDAGERLLATATTDSKGEYTFSDVLPGDYLVRVSGAALGDGVFTTTGTAATKAIQDVTVNKVGVSNLGIDFGLDINDAPVAKDNKYTVLEDTKLVANVITDTDATSGTDSDVDNKLSELTLVGFTVDTDGNGTVETFAAGATAAIKDTGGSAIGDLTLAKDGSLTFVPATNYFGSVPLVKYTIQDTDGATSSATVTLGPVQNVNDAPVAKDNTYAVVEDTKLVANVITDTDAKSGTDSDIDNKLSELTVVSFKVDTNGDNAAESFTAGQDATIKNAAGATVGVLTIGATGALTFTPATNYNGSVPTATYTIKDPSGSTSTASVFLGPVTAVNDLPEGTDTEKTTLEDTPYKVSVTDFGFKDADAGDSLKAVSIETVASNGKLQLSGKDVTAGTLVSAADIAAGNLLFVPDANENGAPYGNFTFKVQDQQGGFDPVANTFILNVTPVNDSPGAVDDKATTKEDTPVFIDVLANDNDNDPQDVLSVAAINETPVTLGGPGVVVNGPAGTPVGTVQLVTQDGKPQLKFTPVENYNGPVDFKYTVTDGTTPVQANVVVTVIPVNDAPVAVADKTNTQEDIPVTIKVLPNDTDVDVGDTLTVVSNTAPTQGGTVKLNPDGTFSYTPKLDFVGTDTFTYTIKDSGGLTSTTTVTIDVGGVNDAPEANPDTGTTTEDKTLVVDKSQGVILSGAGAGADTDLDGDSLTVSDVKFGNVSGTVGSAIEGTWGTLTLKADGSYTYVPNEKAQTLDDGESQVDEFTYTVSDGNLTDSTTLKITVTGLNDPPVAIDDSGTTKEGTPITIDVLKNDTDVDGETLKVTEVNGVKIATGTPVDLFDNTPQKNKIGTVTLEPTGQLTFTPVPLFNGTPVFDYTVSDGTATDIGTVTISVDNVNDLPNAQDDVFTTDEDSAVSFDPLSNDTDPDGDPLTITQINGTAIKLGDAPIDVGNGTIQMVVGTQPGTTQLKFVPDANFFGEQTFKYTVNDGRDGTDIATVTITIVSKNDLPEGTDTEKTTLEDTPYKVSVTDFGFKDADAGDSLKAVSIETVASNGKLQLSGKDVTAGTLVSAADIAAGNLLFVPDANENGAPYGNFTFKVQDQQGGFDPVANTFILNVTPVNDSPGAVDDKATTKEDTPVFIDVLANDNDNDPQDVLSVAAINETPVTLGGPGVVVNGPAGTPVGTVQLVTQDGKPQLKFTPVENYNGPVDFKYTVTDGTTPVQANVVVTVIPVNDAPVAVADKTNTQEDIPVTIKVLPNDTDVDVGDTLTVVSNTAPTQGGTVKLNPDGTFSYTPKLDFVGTDTFTYTIKDSGGLTSTTTVTIDVGGVNDAPEANPDTGTTTEDKTLVVDKSQGVILSGAGAGADTDLDGDSLTVSDVKFGNVSGTVGSAIEGTWGTLTLKADGSYTYVPNEKAQTLDDGESQVDEFTYTVSDGNLTDSTTLKITVTGLNDPPVAIDDSGTTKEGTPITIDVLKNDTDVDGETLKVTEVNGVKIATGTPVDLFDNTPQKNKIGTVTLEPTGQLTFTPVPLFNGTPVFDYTVSDGTATDIGTVTISVDNVNDLPNAQDDVFTTDEDSAVSFDPLSNDTDPDGDPLTITQINGTAIKLGDAPIDVGNGTIQMVVGTQPGTTQLKFVPDANFFGEQTFKYTVNDGRDGTDIATVTITIVSKNDLPEGKDAEETTPEDTPYKLTVANFGFTDSDAGDSLKAVSIETVASNGKLQLSGKDVTAGTLVSAADIAAGNLLFVPDANENGAPYGNFTFKVQDQQGGFDPVANTFILNVTPVNDSPGAVDDKATTKEDTPVFIDVLANDNDNDPQDVLSVAAINETPVTLGGPGVVVNGPAGTPVGTVQLVTQDGKPQLKFTPVENYNGPVDFKYTVTDGTTPVQANVVVTVIPVNDAPVAVADKTNTQEDIPVTIKVLPNDTDVDVGDTLTVVSNTAPTQGGTVKLNPDGTFSYTPKLDFVGTDTFTYTIKDSGGLTSTTTVTIDVGGVNDAPEANPDTGTTTEDKTLVVDKSQGVILSGAGAGADTDLDGDSLTVSDVKFGNVSGTVGSAIEGTWGTLTLKADGSYTYVPNEKAQTLDDGESQVDEFTYTVSDGNLTDSTTLKITVTGLNDPPVAIDDSGTTKEGTPITIDVLKNDTDVDGETLKVTEVNGVKIATGTPVDLFDNTPQKNKIGTVTLEPTGQLTFTPVPLYNGPVLFDYTVSDGTATDTATVKISVDDVNDLPDAQDDVFTTDEDAAVNFDPLSNDIDVDGDVLTITQINGTPIKLGDAPIDVGNGTIQMVDGTQPGTTQLKFVPDEDFNGTQTFKYTVDDGRGGTDIATVTITVAAVNDPPEFVDPNGNPLGDNVSVTTPEDTPVEGTLQAGDPDGDPLTFALIDPPANGAVVVNPDGTWKYTPDPDYNGPDEFDVQVSDGQGGIDTLRVNITVTPVNDPPEFVDPNGNPLGDNVSVTTPEDTPVEGTLQAGDPDGDPLTFALIDPPANGTVVVNPDGTWKYTPDPDYNGPDEFDVQVSDGQGGIDTLRVNITVTPVNDPPEFVDPNGNPLGDNVSVTTPEDTPVAGTLQAGDPDGDPLTFSLTNPPANGTVVVNPDGSWKYTPNPDYNGLDVFDVQVSDGKGGIDTLKVNITVTPVNDLPRFVDPVTGEPLGDDVSVTTPQEVPVSGVLAAKDVDNDPLTFSLNALPANGSAVVNTNGTWTYTPGPGFSGQDTFTVIVSDGKGGTDLLRVNITVTPVAAPAPAPAPDPVVPPPPPAPPAEPLRGPDAEVPENVPAAEFIEPPAIRTGLFVLYAVGDAAAEQSATNTTGLATLDLSAPLFGEALGQLPDGLLYESSNRGEPLGLIQEPAFGEIVRVMQSTPVQNSVRHVPIVGEGGLFVQLAVRSSQLESIVRSAMVDSQNSATAGYVSLQDPFALGATQVLGSAGTQVAEIEPVAEQRPAIAFKPAEGEQKSAVVHEVPQKATPEVQKAAMGFRSQIERFAKDRQQSARPITRSATVKS